MAHNETPLPRFDAPPGYRARAVTPDDAEAAAELGNACHLALTGRPTIEAGEIRSDWLSPGMDLATKTQGVFAADGAMAGLAEVWEGEPHVRYFIYAEVHPAHRGRGIGAGLARWTEARSRQLVAAAPEGARVVMRQFKLDADEPAGRLLAAQGYAVVRHNLRMVIDFDGSPPAAIAPDGLVIRPFVREREETALVQAVCEAFRDHWGHVEQPFDQELREWRHWMDTSPSFEPALALVAVDGDEIAGTALCYTRCTEDPESGWVHALGVRRPWRRRGVGLALLRQCFVELYARGKRRAGLGVDSASLTGATRLYEKAGMHLERSHAMWEKELRAGVDLSTREIAD